jgi:cellulose synthase/poly-beta-1,6-N-acetylglucosamine synthase-like glycosyltransferase
MAKHKPQKAYKVNSVGFARMMEKAIKNIKSGDMIYIAFSKKSFYALLFTIGMAIIANVILAYLLAIYPIWTWGIYMFMYIILFILSVVTIFSGLWLIFKGIDIVTDDEDFK